MSKNSYMGLQKTMRDVKKRRELLPLPLLTQAKLLTAVPSDSTSTDPGLKIPGLLLSCFLPFFSLFLSLSLLFFTSQLGDYKSPSAISIIGSLAEAGVLKKLSLAG
jgi:hypothetical protein